MIKTSAIASKATEFVKKIQKRDGHLEDFDLRRIANAIYKAMLASGEGSEIEASMIANKVFADLVRISKKYKNFVPTVEGVQDSVEKELILGEYIKTSKAYILYRSKKAELREKGYVVPEKVHKLAQESKKYFKNSLAEFIYYRSYSRWIEEEGRRETWIETVDRYMAFMRENLGDKLKESEYGEIREYILNLKTMPSMRLMWSAGVAARESNVTGYNCSFIAPSKLQDLGEIMYLSMCGTGVGFSVESYTAQKFSLIKKQTGKKRKTHAVADSKIGWVEAFVFGLKTWFAGEDVEFDYSKIRPMGAKLKTMGGKASGPGPLMDLMHFSREKILKKQGKRLNNLDLHDVICKIGEIVVAGGVRRSALISLSDLDDKEMRDAKKGQFYLSEGQRSMANNSAVYLEKPNGSEFFSEWLALIESRSGERGIFNRGGLEKQLPERRWKTLGKHKDTAGTNPCGEIILRSKQFCNLTEVVARHEDTEKTLLEKIRIATIIGTYQSTLTNFKYLSSEWKKNCEEERLLGVSITGQWDSPAARKPEILSKLKEEALKVNKEYAKRFKINPSTCITCVKPSGTVSQLVDSASGMHPRHSQYYIRRVRISTTDSLFKMLKDQGVPYHPEVGQTMDGANTYVIEFPVKSPDKSVFRDDMSAIEQLEYWKNVKMNFTEHNPSTTVSVGDSEWVGVANWIYENWDYIGGLSFLPREDHVYKLAPYEEIDEKTYKEMMKRFEGLDYSKIMTYEREDETKGSKELACVSGVCEM
ncbi:MAG: ribonucleoside-triphosphate reductase [Candidatus Terrybacteria bacterium CG10_big_fil_rev_8_21_14_0_10_41_10]|uniref:ribonucleoside-triphosphate reductase (thioredoxin) n=1 Tax=Candidatus Terrybacteria bacterium CG10_big_fil_rev_8_21_14_0_10_41_10 TaxID=1975026 RepID=A0A2M8LAC4_9BACT|nr:MAG: ribonucleoside-triphosphate reductase [Candidatus Terrybacteria bacterium CG10_big_fil_rev_8_21_14_0_10_41_10]